jgi:hypothetical protein
LALARRAAVIQYSTQRAGSLTGARLTVRMRSGGAPGVTEPAQPAIVERCRRAGDLDGRRRTV